MRAFCWKPFNIFFKKKEKVHANSYWINTVTILITVLMNRPTINRNSPFRFFDDHVTGHETLQTLTTNPQMKDEKSIVPLLSGCLFVCVLLQCSLLSGTTKTFWGLMAESKSTLNQHTKLYRSHRDHAMDLPFPRDRCALWWTRRCWLDSRQWDRSCKRLWSDSELRRFQWCGA